MKGRGIAKLQASASLPRKPCLGLVARSWIEWLFPASGAGTELALMGPRKRKQRSAPWVFLSVPFRSG